MGILLKYFRLFIAGIIIAIFAIFGFIFCLFRPFHKNNSHILARLLHKITRPVFGFKVVVIDEEKIEQAEKPCIYVSNHQSNLDIFILGAMMPKDVVSLGKKDILRIPFFGQMYWLAGNIVIDRFNRSKAMQAMAKVAKVMKDEEEISDNVGELPAQENSGTNIE